MSNSQSIISWLKYLDIEYLDEDLSAALSKLDINDPADQKKIIHLAMQDEVISLNEISRNSMTKILDEVESYPENEVRQIMEMVGMPFSQPLIDYKAFFARVRNELKLGNN